MEKEYKTEEEFLKNYDSSQFEKLSATSDILIFSVASSKQDNYRKLNNKHFSVLLVKRDQHPFKDKWCLPGGFIGIDETSEDAAKRILARETNLHNIYLEQLYTFDDVKRDPRMRIISISYVALVDKNRLDDTLYENASWFNMDIEEDEERIKVNEHGKGIGFSIPLSSSTKYMIDFYKDYYLAVFAIKSRYKALNCRLRLNQSQHTV